jgi:hypothetical protein
MAEAGNMESIIQSAPLARLLGVLVGTDTPPEAQNLILKDERVVSLLLYSSSWLSFILPELNSEQLLSLSCSDNIPRWIAQAAENRFQELTASAVANDPDRPKRRRRRKTADVQPPEINESENL